MITATWTCGQKQMRVRVLDALNGSALIETLDGSKRFVHDPARMDPEYVPYGMVRTTWSWVPRNEIRQVRATEA